MGPTNSTFSFRLKRRREITRKQSKTKSKLQLRRSNLCTFHMILKKMQCEWDLLNHTNMASTNQSQNPSLLPEIGPDGLPREAPVIAYTEKIIEQEQIQLRKWVSNFLFVLISDPVLAVRLNAWFLWYCCFVPPFNFRKNTVWLNLMKGFNVKLFNSCAIYD